MSKPGSFTSEIIDVPQFHSARIFQMIISLSMASGNSSDFLAWCCVSGLVPLHPSICFGFSCRFSFPWSRLTRCSICIFCPSTTKNCEKMPRGHLSVFERWKRADSNLRCGQSISFRSAVACKGICKTWNWGVWKCILGSLGCLSWYLRSFWKDSIYWVMVWRWTHHWRECSQGEDIFTWCE